MVMRDIYLIRTPDHKWCLCNSEFIPLELEGLPEHMYKIYEIEDASSADFLNYVKAWDSLLGEMYLLNAKEIEPTPDNYDDVFPVLTEIFKY